MVYRILFSRTDSLLGRREVVHVSFSVWMLNLYLDSFNFFRYSVFLWLYVSLINYFIQITNCRLNIWWSVHAPLLLRAIPSSSNYYGVWMKSFIDKMLYRRSNFIILHFIFLGVSNSGTQQEPLWIAFYNIQSYSSLHLTIPNNWWLITILVLYRDHRKDLYVGWNHVGLYDFSGFYFSSMDVYLIYLLKLENFKFHWLLWPGQFKFIY